MKPHRILITSFLFLVVLNYTRGQQATILDSHHYSNVFGETRNYRIFLPPSYFRNSQKKYPVIYFYHGWSQRYFGASNPYADYDKGDENNGDNIANYVSTHEVIIVKADGYNRSAGETYYVRPYNVSPVETYRQFPIYFPELVKYIDGHYRTLSDRQHRAISGLSMGGFMTFWIAAKYPDLVVAAGSFCGSPEFEVGPKDFPSEYRHIDMYKNYGGVKLRLNYGDKDFIRSYHEDMNRIWPQLMNNYEFRIYDAAHSTCGMSDMFNFILKTFAQPLPKPVRWDHTDVYPSFSVWDYQIQTDRDLPGYTVMDKVDSRGFKVAVREFVPGGKTMPFVKVSITTAPIYEKSQWYVINDIETRTLKARQTNILSDNSGRLRINIDGAEHEIGINKKSDKPNLTIADVQIENMNWAMQGKDVVISIKLLNKGMAPARNVKANLSPTKNTTLVKRSSSIFDSIGINETKSGGSSFSFLVKGDSIEVAKFRLSLQDENKNRWTEDFDIDIKKDLPQIKDFEIADGRMFTVAKSGVDSERVVLGNGNGDGIANPGESIVLLVRDRNKYWRTQLTTSDEMVNPFGINERKSDNWSSMDHVGASTKYSVPLISSATPEGHNIEFFAEYWLPEYPLHIIRQGKINIEVKGKDNTPPIINWARVTGENIIQAKVTDGSKLSSVKAKLILQTDSSKTIELVLTDDGIEGDAASGDNIFTKKIPYHGFGFYKIVIEAVDEFGNRKREESAERVVVY